MAVAAAALLATSDISNDDMDRVLIMITRCPKAVDCSKGRSFAFLQHIPCTILYWGSFIMPEDVLG